MKNLIASQIRNEIFTWSVQNLAAVNNKYVDDLAARIVVVLKERGIDLDGSGESDHHGGGGEDTGAEAGQADGAGQRRTRKKVGKTADS